LGREGKGGGGGKEKGENREVGCLCWEDSSRENRKKRVLAAVRRDLKAKTRKAERKRGERKVNVAPDFEKRRKRGSGGKRTDRIRRGHEEKKEGKKGKCEQCEGRKGGKDSNNQHPFRNGSK
jgi:hypothetical protein